MRRLVLNFAILPLLMIGLIIPMPSWDVIVELTSPNANLSPTKNLSLSATQAKIVADSLIDIDNPVALNDSQKDITPKTISKIAPTAAPSANEIASTESLAIPANEALPDGAPSDTSLSLGASMAEAYQGVTYNDATRTMTVLGESGSKQTVTFNEADQPIETVDQDGQKKIAEYDENGNMTSMTDANGTKNNFEYDENGNLLRSYNEEQLGFTQPKSLWSKIFSIDALAADNVAKTTSYTYDENDNVTGIAAAKGSVNYKYNEGSGLPVEATNTDGSQIQYSYNEFGNIISKNLITKAPTVTKSPISKLFSGLYAHAEPAVNDQEQTFFYDELGTATGSETTVNSLGIVSNTKKVSLWQKMFDLQPRAQAENSAKVVQKHQLNIDGAITETTNLQNEVTKYSYDLNGNITNVKVLTAAGSVISDSSYTYDENLNRTTRSDSFGNNSSYTYDALGQLIKIVENGITTTYTYDAMGNRKSETNGNATKTYDYLLTRLNKFTDQSGQKTSFGYDNNGNILNKSDVNGVTSYFYNTAGYIERITRPDKKVIKYGYDGLNRRVTREFDGITVNYIYDGENIVAIKDTKGQTISQYIYDVDGRLIALANGGKLYNLLLDNHNNVIGVTDENSNLVEKYSYDAWGKIISSPDKPISQFLYSSYFYDQDAGLYVNGPRLYDPTLGRFMSKDPLPIDLEQSIGRNEYIYCFNDPVNYVDPDGHWGIKNFMNDVAAAAKAAANKIAEEARRIYEATKAAAEAAARRIAQAAADAAEAARKAAAAVKAAADAAARKAAQAAEAARVAAAEAKRKAEEAVRVAAEKAQKAAEAIQKAAAEEARKVAAEIQRRREEAARIAEQKRIAEEAAQKVREAEEKARLAKQAEEKRIAAENLKKTQEIAAAKSAEQMKSIAAAVAARLAAAKNAMDRLAAIKSQASIVSSNTKMCALPNGKISTASIQNWQKNSLGAGTTSIHIPSTPISTTKYNTINNIVMGKPVSAIKSPAPIVTTNQNTKLIAYSASAGIGFIPVVGDGYDLLSALTGHDYITNEDLNWWERLISSGATFIPFVSGSQIRAVKNGAKVVKIEINGANATKDALKLSNDALLIRRGFKSDTYLLGHFTDHGWQFGAKTKEEYLKLAQTFDSSRSPDILTKTRKANGDIIRYNPKTNEFLVRSNNNSIRTYFKPDTSSHLYKTNLDYFNAQ